MPPRPETLYLSMFCDLLYKWTAAIIRYHAPKMYPKYAYLQNDKKRFAKVIHLQQTAARRV